MNTSLFSSSWYRVADLKPRLRAHTAVHRQVFRGKIWYILQDHQTGRFHRLSPIANLMLCLMDGRRTMRDIWDAAGRKTKDDPPTQDETIHLLAQLHAADLLQGEIPPDFDEMAERSEKAGQRKLMQRLRNPLALRIPLFDPNRMLDITLPVVRPVFTVYGFLAWLGLVLTGLVLAVLHWPELTSDVADRVLATENVALIMCVYPVIKSLHELGHAYATKVWGGEVHEVGVMLLVLVALDALTHAPKLNPTVSVRAYGPLDMGQSVKARHGESRALVNPKLQAFLSRAATTNALRYYTGVRRAAYMNCNLLDDIPTASGFFSIYLRSSAKVSSLLNEAPDGLPEPLADFIGASQISAPDTSFTWIDRPNFMPLATAGQKPVFVDADETLKAISSPSFNPRSTVFLPIKARDFITVSNQSAARIVSRIFLPQRAQLEVQADEPAMVVVAQTFYHPWHAYVDGRRVPLWEANYAFQALQVPAGHHEVKLVYEDRMFETGAIISLATLLCMGLGWFWRQPGGRLPHPMRV